MQITAVQHPLLQVKMSILRSLSTDYCTLRRAIGEVAMQLSLKSYIVPGLSDAGSRIYGTV